jgi:hypothetical protein
MHAVNVNPLLSSVPGNVELWGATTACGPVTELLWFGPIRGGQQCAEFTPTKDISRLMAVTRTTEPVFSLFAHGVGDVTVCSKGTCPGGKDGQGRTPGAALVAPPGAYKTDNSLWFGGRQFDVGMWGWMLALYTSDRTPENGKLGAVPFRMPPTDPYGDTWYVGGAGSTMMDGRTSGTYIVEARGLQRLPSCADLDGAGTATLRWTAPNGSRNGSSISSVPGLDGANLYVEGSCSGDRCGLWTLDEASNTTHLFVTVDGDLGTRGAPTGKPVPVVEAMWFRVPVEPAPVTVTCSTGGSVTYTPAGESIFTLGALGALVPATGSAVTPDSVRFVLDW